MVSAAVLDGKSISAKAKTDLLRLLEGVPGKKTILIERSLTAQLDKFVTFTTLQEYGVDKIFFLGDPVSETQKNVVYIAHSSERNATAIARSIKLLQNAGEPERSYSIFWVPNRTLVCDHVLEAEGVLGEVKTQEFPLSFIALDDDVLSLQLDHSFRDMFLHRDPSALFHSAKALMLIEEEHGLFPRITGKGDSARRLADLLLKMRQEAAADEEADPSATALGLSPSSTIERLIIIDRETDLATPLLTQLTYEGLLDEVYSIENSQITVDSSVIGAAQQKAAAGTSQQERTQKVKLDSSDKLFDQIRNNNFAVVGDLLNTVARRLQSDYERRHAAQSIADLREFVNRLPGYQSEQQKLKIHANLAEEVRKFTETDTFKKALEVQQNFVAGGDASLQHDNVEEMIARDMPLQVVLRLLCLESVVSGGLKQKDLDSFKRQILQGYGYQHLLTLDALERMGLLQVRSATNVVSLPVSAAGQRTNYANIRKQLRLILDFEEVDELNPTDIAYVYSGYAPLSVRLVQCVLQKSYLLGLIKGEQQAKSAASATANLGQGWRGFEEPLKNVKGRLFDETQKGEDKAMRARMILNASHEKRTDVVFFLGGITYTEIAALRFIAKKESDRRRIIICTTGIISGNRMIDAAIATSRPA